MALNAVKKGEVIAFPWTAVPDHEDACHLIQSIPSHWLTDEKFQLFHGTGMFQLPDIRRHGLLPRKNGAGVTDGSCYLFVCKKRQRPLKFYAGQLRDSDEGFKFRVPARNMSTPYEQCVEKEFKVVFGIESLEDPKGQTWTSFNPHAGKGIAKQFCMARDRYRPAWVEFHCIQGECDDSWLKQMKTEQKYNSNEGKWDRAKTVIHSSQQEIGANKRHTNTTISEPTPFMRPYRSKRGGVPGQIPKPVSYTHLTLPTTPYV